MLGSVDLEGILTKFSAIDSKIFCDVTWVDVQEMEKLHLLQQISDTQQAITSSWADFERCEQEDRGTKQQIQVYIGQSYLRYCLQKSSVFILGVGYPGPGQQLEGRGISVSGPRPGSWRGGGIQAPARQLEGWRETTSMSFSMSFLVCFSDFLCLPSVLSENVYNKYFVDRDER